MRAVHRLEPDRLDRLCAELAAAPPSMGPRVRHRGAYYTPPPLARFLAERLLSPLLARVRWDAGVPRLRVLDPAVGDGRLLRATLEVIVRAARGRGARPDADAIAARCFLGLERDAATAQALRAAWPALPVTTCEALTASPPAAQDVDAVIGNPPYVRSIRLRAVDAALWRALRGRLHATSTGEWDLYAAFLEQSVAWVRPGGRVGLIVPSRWMLARTAGPLRAHLSTAVREIVDFGAMQVFAGATTYTSIAVLERGRRSKSVPLARLGTDGWTLGELAVTSDGAPWVARSTTRGGDGPTLAEIVTLAKGAGTNADGVFVLPSARVEGAWVVATCDGRPVRVEAAATRPCLRGRDVVAWGAASAHPRAIVPYDVHGRLLPWAAFEARWPRAAAYLRTRRATLVAREGGRFARGAWHAFGRPQNLALHLGPRARVVVPDVTRAPRAMIAPAGTLVIDSAYAAYVRDGVPDAYADPHLWMAILSSPTVAAWLAARSVPLRGGYTRMKPTALAGLPLPAPAAARAIANAARAGDRDQAEARLAAAVR